MSILKKIVPYLFLSALSNGCFTPDEVLPAAMHSEIVLEIDIDDNKTAYLNLNEPRQQFDNKSEDWHLKFQNITKGWAIFLNTSLNVAVYNTRETNFHKIDSTMDLSSIHWRLDIPTNQGSYPAIGSWGDYSFDQPKSYQNVYLISWSDGTENHVYKLQILDARENEYQIRYGTLNGEVLKSQSITKDQNYLHSYFSFATRTANAAVEPPVDDWNLCLTFLSDSISSYPNIPYIETINKFYGLYQGLTINQDNTQVYIDSLAQFEDIDFFYAKNKSFKKIDGLYNNFYSWNEEKKQIDINQICLILKNRERYFVVKSKDILLSPFSKHKVTLQIKQL